MARTTKQGLDYFPHSCNYDSELKYLIAKHKEKGYYIYFEILRCIYKDTGYYFNATEKYLVLLADEIKVNINEINDIINTCLQEKLLDPELFRNFQILTSKGIQERYLDAIIRRKEISLIKDYILLDKIDVDKKTKNVSINWLNVDKSTQSRVEESKEEERRGDNSNTEIKITAATQVLKILNEINPDKLEEMKELTMFSGNLDELKQKFAVEFITRYGLNKTSTECVEAFQSWMHKAKNFKPSKSDEVESKQKAENLIREKIKKTDSFKIIWNKIMMKISKQVNKECYKNYLDLSIIEYDDKNNILLMKASKKEIADALDPELINPLLKEFFGEIELQVIYK